MKRFRKHKISNFVPFYRLRFSQKGFLTIAGFSELEEAERDDIDPWLPHTPVMEPKLDLETSKYIAAKVGDKFCELVEQERHAMSEAGDEGIFIFLRSLIFANENATNKIISFIYICISQTYKMENKFRQHCLKVIARHIYFLFHRKKLVHCQTLFSYSQTLVSLALITQSKNKV